MSSSSDLGLGLRESASPSDLVERTLDLLVDLILVRLVSGIDVALLVGPANLAARTKLPLIVMVLLAESEMDSFTLGTLEDRRVLGFAYKGLRLAGTTGFRLRFLWNFRSNGLFCNWSLWPPPALLLFDEL